MAKRNKQQKRQAKKNRNQNRHQDSGYKKHSKNRYRSVADWPDQEEFEELRLFPAKKKSKREKRSVNYHADMKEIVFLELGGYYWCPGAELKELHDDENIEVGR